MNKHPRQPRGSLAQGWTQRPGSPAKALAPAHAYWFEMRAQAGNGVLSGVLK